MGKRNEINKDEFKIKVTMGSGPGGQHRNRKMTSVTITHLPTGLQEKCEDTRSKIRNQEIAFERLRQRLITKANEEKHQLLNEKRNKIIEEKGTIRTNDYKRNVVKNHKNGKEAPLKKVLSGDIDLIK